MRLEEAAIGFFLVAVVAILLLPFVVAGWEDVVEPGFEATGAIAWTLRTPLVIVLVIILGFLFWRTNR